MRNRVQLTTDGHRAYLDAVEEAFAWEIDYAMLVKQYGEGQQSPERKYSPSEYVGAKKIKVTGNPVKRTFQRHSLSVRTSRCACHAAASRG